MASGQHYYQRIGQWNSNQQDLLGKRITDPQTGRIFEYNKINASTGINKVAHGTPLHRLNTATYASAHHLTADISSLFRAQFAGVAMVNDAKGSAQFANAKATSGYGWIMTNGPLGQNSTSQVYSLTAYALASTGASTGNALQYGGSTKSHAKMIVVSQKSTSTKPFVGFAGSTPDTGSAMTLAVPLTKGWINAPAAAG
jgi:hypothetical protein